MTDKNRKQRISLSAKQKQQVHTLVKKMLAIGKYPSEIKTEVAARFHLSRKSVGRYMTRARQELDESIEEDTEQIRAEAYYFYRSIIANEENSTRERLRARIRIDKLLRLDKQVPSKKQMPRKN